MTALIAIHIFLSVIILILNLKVNKMSVTKDERAIVVISELTSRPPEKARLYNFIEISGRSLCESILKDDYVDYVTLYDDSATKANLIQTLQAIGAKVTIKAIDLIIMLHGSSGSLGFYGVNGTTATLASEIAALNLKNKLRLVYSTACYGSSHNADFLKAGFSTSIGARKVNANAEVELPPLLQLWARGYSIKDALSVGENPLTRQAADTAARLYAHRKNLSYKDDINSDKVLLGDDQLTINSNG
jgi:hypothetical protein